MKLRLTLALFVVAIPTITLHGQSCDTAVWKVNINCTGPKCFGQYAYYACTSIYKSTSEHCQQSNVTCCGSSKTDYDNFPGCLAAPTARTRKSNFLREDAPFQGPAAFQSTSATNNLAGKSTQ
jgi:hypothetical protein